MKYILKKVRIIIPIFIILILSVSHVNAENYWGEAGEINELEEEITKQYQELLGQSGAEELFSLIPDDARGTLEKNNIDTITPDTLIDIDIFSFIKGIFVTVRDSATKPLSMLLSCIGIIMLYALLNSFKSGFNDGSYERVFSVVSVICISSAIIMPIAQMITKAAELIKQISSFILSFVPVYVGIITASGKPISSVSYSVSLIGAVQVISRMAAVVLVPLLAVYLAFCLIGATSTQISIDGIARSVKNAVIVSLGFLMTVFVGLLTIQGIVASSSDTVTTKATKFAISTFLPVVGSAVSEAFNSVQGCLSLIKSTVGTFGIITLIAAFLPSIISILLMQLSLSISSGIGDMLQCSRITSLLRSASSVLSLLLGILLIFFILLVVSIGIMLTLAGG